MGRKALSSKCILKRIYLLLFDAVQTPRGMYLVFIHTSTHMDVNKGTRCICTTLSGIRCLLGSKVRKIRTKLGNFKRSQENQKNLQIFVKFRNKNFCVKFCNKNFCVKFCNKNFCVKFCNKNFCV